MGTVQPVSHSHPRSYRSPSHPINPTPMASSHLQITYTCSIINLCAWDCLPQIPCKNLQAALLCKTVLFGRKTVEPKAKHSQALDTVPNLRDPLVAHSAAGLPPLPATERGAQPYLQRGNPTMSNDLYPSCNAADAPQNSKEEARRRYVPRRRINTKPEFLAAHQLGPIGHSCRRTRWLRRTLYRRRRPRTSRPHRRRLR